MNKEIKSLYRVHRPKQFTEVIGQEHITKTLMNQIEKNNIGHAYLFCGTRGTGKTTVAKIFANAVNCLNFKNGKICGTCAFCKSGQGSLDVFELDAASNNRVEDVRELIEKVKYPPISSKYKVYIVDEVHMFSASAFNAFLKTLEEPPSHVIFILATTEAHKLLPTVQSRCLRFDFRTVSDKEISKLVEEIFKKENIKAEKEAIETIAKAGCGSVRDALSFADMVSAYSGDDITLKGVTAVLGSVGKNTLKELLNSIIEEDIKKITEITDSVFTIGRNINAVIKDFLEVIKDSFIENFSDKVLSTYIMEIYKIFSELELSIKTATDTKTMLQGACFLSIAAKKKLEN